MRTLIAPIDFSDSSDNALSYAAELANRANARLIILHALQNRNGQSDAEEKLKAAAAGLKKSYGEQLSARCCFCTGILFPQLKKPLQPQM